MEESTQSSSVIITSTTTTTKSPDPVSNLAESVNEGLKRLLETNCIKGTPLYHGCVPLCLNPKGREGSSFFWPILRATHHAQSPQPRNGERERERAGVLVAACIHPFIHSSNIVD